MRVPQVGSLRVFKPVMFDEFYESPDGKRLLDELAPGTYVRVVQPRNCPQNGTMGMCFVHPLADDGTERDHLVCAASLYPMSKKAREQWKDLPRAPAPRK